jgi:hypothetical protein
MNTPAIPVSKYAAKVRRGGSRYWQQTAALREEENRQCAIREEERRNYRAIYGEPAKL